MTTVLLTVHTLIVLALIGIVLVQRSEGGALGIGGGGGGGFMSGRGAANVLTRTTSILAALFFSTSIALAFVADRGETAEEISEELTGEEIPDADGPVSGASLEELTEGLAPSPADEDDPETVQDALDSLGAEDGAAEGGDEKGGDE
ncbi:MAG: preprotein translocase subunit SecG [Pseudomonadota bacterium]